jgi:hypothetical protein
MRAEAPIISISLELRTVPDIGGSNFGEASSVTGYEATMERGIAWRLDIYEIPQGASERRTTRGSPLP